MTRHTPVIPLFEDGNHVGAQCLHCGMILTENGTPSQPTIVKNPPHNKPGQVRIVSNLSHNRRAMAAANRVTKSIRDRIRDLLS